MKIKNKHSNSGKYRNSSRRLVLISAVAALIIALCGYYYYSTNTKYQNSLDKSSGSTDVDDSPSSVTSNPDTSTPSDGSPVKTDKPDTYNQEPTTVDTGASMAITSASQDGDTVRLRAVASDTIIGGRCIAYFTSEKNDAQSFYLDTASPSEGTVNCSKDISAQRFSYLGLWSVRVVYTTPNDTIVENSAKITIR